MARTGNFVTKLLPIDPKCKSCGKAAAFDLYVQTEYRESYHGRYCSDCAGIIEVGLHKPYLDQLRKDAGDKGHLIETVPDR